MDFHLIYSQNSGNHRFVIEAERLKCCGLCGQGAGKWSFLLTFDPNNNQGKKLLHIMVSQELFTYFGKKCNKHTLNS